MEEKKDIPQIRFSEYGSEWKEHFIGEITIELSEYATLNSSYPLLTSSRDGLMFQNHYRNNRTTENDTTLFSIIPFGKCTYRHMSDDDIFHFNINEIVENGLVSKEYPVFDSTEGNDLRFIVLLLNSSKHFRKFCRERKIGGTRTRLYYKNLCSFVLKCPEIIEQSNISDFLGRVDAFIFQQQSKIEKLQILKSSMLEKMFPKGSADVPEIRFGGFTDVWKQRKFSELYERASTKNDLTYSEKDIISVANMYYKPDSSITDAEYLRTYNVFLLGDIAFEGNKSKHFAHGRFVENTIGDGIVSHVFDVFRPTTDFDLAYWKYAINNEQIMGPVLMRCTKASTMMTNLVSRDFLEENILVPSIEEQRKIGFFLQELDNLIMLHQREFAKLESLKKALLEKMFV